MALDNQLLEANGLSRRADENGRWLLRDVSLQVDGGDRIAIAGPSGAGKTVLLRALAMLDPLDAGELRWRGEPVDGHRAPEFRRAVMYLQQRPALIEGTVEDNLQQPFSLLAHRERSYNRENIAALLERLGRDRSFLDQQHSDLSGGEAQIVALLRAMQLDPSVLLLDEATASMDAAAAETAERMILGWCDERPDERATVWVSHDLRQAQRVATRFVKIDNATVVEEPTA